MGVSLALMIGVMRDAQHYLCDSCPQIESERFNRLGPCTPAQGAVHGEIKAGTLGKGGSVRKVLGRWSSVRSG